MRLIVAQTKSTPAVVLAILASDANPEVRNAVLVRISYDSDPAEDLLDVLANHANPEFRSDVADHVWTTADVLRRLARDTTTSIRLSVACHTSTPINALQELSGDKEAEVREFVRLAVAENLAAPAELLTLLQADSDPAVSTAAKFHLNATRI
ncbi:hypothetical protein [Cryobacterium sp. Y29]|uniref:hypothetical protein n=1 Tax=Cryobacterium sp. Y29 TaxID=2048285 RepID=UPI000CE4DD05|nr:hypothetical protein [Cryobacterium sp. Y29]